VQPATGQDPVLRGVVTRASTSAGTNPRWLFTACGGTVQWPLVDETGHVLEEASAAFGPRSENGEFLEGEGEIRPTDNGPTAILRSLRALAREGMDCRTALRSGDLRISGNEPSWTVILRGKTGRLATMEATLDLALAEPPAPDAGWPLAQNVILLDTSLPDPVRRPLQLRLETGPCYDTMSGARFPYRAVLLWAGVEWIGCGMDGREQLATPQDRQ